MPTLYVLRPCGAVPGFLEDQRPRVVAALPGETVQESLDREFSRRDSFVSRVRESGPLGPEDRTVIVQSHDVALRVALDLEIIRFRRSGLVGGPLTLRGCSTHGRALRVWVWVLEDAPPPWDRRLPLPLLRTGQHREPKTVIVWDDRAEDAEAQEERAAVLASFDTSRIVEIVHSPRTAAYAVSSEFDEWAHGTRERAGAILLRRP